MCGSDMPFTALLGLASQLQLIFWEMTTGHFMFARGQIEKDVRSLQPCAAELDFGIVG